MKWTAVVLCVLVVLPLMAQGGNIGKVDYDQKADVKASSDEEKEMANIPDEFKIFLQEKKDEHISLDKEMSQAEVEKVADQFQVFLQSNNDESLKVKREKRILSEEEIDKFNEGRKRKVVSLLDSDGSLKAKKEKTLEKIMSEDDTKSPNIEDDEISAKRKKDETLENIMSEEDERSLRVKKETMLEKIMSEDDAESPKFKRKKTLEKVMSISDDDESSKLKKKNTEKEVSSEENLDNINENNVPDKFKAFLKSGDVPQMKRVERKMSQKEFEKYELDNIPDDIAELFMKMRAEPGMVKREARKMSEDEVYEYNKKQLKRISEDNVPAEFSEFLKPGAVAPAVKAQKRVLSEDEILNYNKRQFKRWHGKEHKHNPQKMDMEFNKWEWHMRKFQRQQQIRAEKLKKYRNHNWQRVEAALRKQRNKHSAWLKKLLQRPAEERRKKHRGKHLGHHHGVKHRSPNEPHHFKKNKYFHHIGL